MVAEDRRSFTGARWAVGQVGDSRVQSLQRSTGLSRSAASVLALRWDGETEQGPSTWLEPSIDHLHDPRRMRNMDAAVDRLRHALRVREKIRVVTDYDVDGTTSSLILQATLRTLEPGIELSYHIPSRFEEGYGFSVRAATQAADDGVGLIVTADIGVRDHAAIAAARERGVEVLVCDHHLPAGASVPEDAIVLCPPQSGDDYPNRALAACGVSFKLAQALLRDHPKQSAILRSMTKLAAIGTVADMVSLGTLENRALVALGLRELNEGQHIAGLKALLDVCRLTPGNIDESSLGYRIGPRINAAGRLAEAALVVELLGTRDPALAAERAQRLDRLNTERRDLQRTLTADAIAQIGENPAPFVCLSGSEADGWHRGVVGIVASRIKDHTNRPTAVISIQGELAVGSVRSPPAVHAVQALDSVSDLLVKYGGHPAAAGFTTRTADLEQLVARLGAYVTEAVGEDALVPVRRADVIVPVGELTDQLQLELARLGPFGNGNPSPALLVPGVRPFGVQVKGQGNQLLKFYVPREQARAVEAVWWDGVPLREQVSQGPLDLLVCLGENQWDGEKRLQLEIKDARPAA